MLSRSYKHSRSLRNMLQHIVEGDHVEPLSVIQDLGKRPYPHWVF
jgi:hypothetical protein